MSEIWASIAKTAGARFYGILLGVLSMSLTARLLGPQGRGEVAAILAWVALFSTFGHLSLGSVAINRATSRKDPQWFGQVVGSLLCITLVLSLLGWAIAYALRVLPGARPFSDMPTVPLALGFLMLPLLVWDSYKSSLLMATERIDLQNRALVVGRTLSLVALYCLVGWFALGPTGAIIATLAGQAVISSGGFMALVKKGSGRLAFSWPETTALLNGALRLHVNAVGTFLFSLSTGVLIVNHARGAEEAGYFQVASQLLGVIMILPQAVSMVIYGKVTALGPNKSWPLNRSILKKSMLITLLGSAVAWVAAPWLITAIAGPAFAPSTELFRTLLPILLGTTLSNALAPQWIGRGLFIQTAMLTLAVGLISLGLSLVLVSRHGMYGAAYATLVAYGIGACVNLVFYAYCNRRSASEKEPG